MTRLTCPWAGDVRPDHVLLWAGNRRRESHPHHSQEHHRQHRLQLQLLRADHVQLSDRSSGYGGEKEKMKLVMFPNEIQYLLFL